MNLLLDTHVYLWMRGDSSRLPESFRKAMVDPKNMCYFSSISAAEIAVKKSIGKLATSASVLTEVEHLGLYELSFTNDHARELENLPLIHRDPFDRMLIAQARVEAMVLLSVDPFVRSYDVETIPLVTR